MKRIILLITLTITLNTSCNDECKGALIDLTTSLFPSVVGTVLAGVPFNIGAVIENAIPAVATCIGNTAGISNSNYKVNYGTSSGNYTSNEENADYAIGSIDSGDSITENFETTFTEPGFYELITITDSNGQVEEDNENNNTYFAENEYRSASQSTQSLGNPKSRLVFEVLPNPDFRPEEGMPKVIMIRL